MSHSIDGKTARIVVVETIPARRMLLADILRGFGYGGVATVDKPQDLLSYLKASPTDWVIMPLASDHAVNGLHLLQIITTHKELQHIRVSMLFTSDERVHIPKAFELGLLSWHATPYNREVMHKSLSALLERLRFSHGDLTLAAADGLREALIELRLPQLRLVLERGLAEFYTGEPEVLVNLAKAQIALGDHTEARVTLNHAELLGKGLKPRLDLLRDQCHDRLLTAADRSGAPEKVNLLGVETCVVIDPDQAARDLAVMMLRDAGVPKIDAFADGTSAWEAMSKRPEPDLVVHEWRLEGIPGPLLLQRIRQHGFLRVPIVVATSLIAPDETPLVLEMGVSAVLEKPLHKPVFFKTIVAALQQHRRPTEQVSLDRRIRQLLESSNLAEAERLWGEFKANPRIPQGAKEHLEAEFLFARGKYADACDLASNALKESRDSIVLLNLLGKCLLKLGRYKVALKCFGRARELSPHNVERLCRIAEAHQGNGDEAASEAALKAAKDLDAQSPAVHETAVGLALLRGDTSNASQLMGELSSTRNLLAFMNNRAIALTRGGQFEDGIALYRNTLSALPGDWSASHDALTYNLGLAFARYGDSAQAVATMARIPKTAGMVIRRKAASIVKRIEEAKKSGSALELSQQEEDSEMDSPGLTSTMDMMATVDLRRGDICCHLLFRNPAPSDSKEAKLLADGPSFTKEATVTPRPARRAAPAPKKAS